jgi:hypothetical protein
MRNDEAVDRKIGGLFHCVEPFVASLVGVSERFPAKHCLTAQSKAGAL